jgi:hypothetical protein
MPAHNIISDILQTTNIWLKAHLFIHPTKNSCILSPGSYQKADGQIVGGNFRDRRLSDF